MPLRVFEDRYLRLVNDLLSLPADRPRAFGVIGIELGHEVGEHTVRQLAQVGCVAEISTVRQRPDEGFDLLVTGVERFRVAELVEPDDDVPYLRAETTPLPDEVGDDAEGWGERVARRFALYRERLNGVGVASGTPGEFPEPPLPRSYSVAGAMILDQSDKQALLEAEHAAARLELAAELLRRENRVLSSLRLLPAGRFLRHEVNLN
ncbi:hypothetical protein EV190_11837 [Actinorugispora endophytica]|uniref:Lon N-terminal domain-containing protein n=2 Tax=Actinorugispora endophytica TaxID=1605990 RepID=A0A4R6UNI8_9ACTN|nr:hypothetical protein EV190_11837 [Actinorugispora endophytica]